MNKIAFGFGNNIDYEVIFDTKIVNKLIASHKIERETIRSYQSVASVKELLVSLISLFKNGKGGEIAVKNIGTIYELAKHLEYRVTMGGTAIRGALELSKIGVPSLVHLKLYNKRIAQYLAKTEVETTPHIVAKEYPHLIIQFNEGDSLEVGGEIIEAPRSNRIIFVNDPHSENFEYINEFFEKVEAHAKTLVISGFNAIKKREIVRKRAAVLKRYLKKLKEKGVEIFFEEAGYHIEEFRREVLDILGSDITILSMNEDEFSSHLSKEMDLNSPEIVCKGILTISKKWKIPYLLLHTRDYALIYGRGAEKYRGGVERGIQLASARLQFGDHYGVEEYRRVGSFEKEEPGVIFAQKVEQMRDFCCVPSIKVEKKVVTIGLGDTFTAGFQLFYQ